MAEKESNAVAGRTRRAPAVVTPWTKVNLALPFQDHRGRAGQGPRRALGLAQAVWPLAVVLSCRHPATAPVGHAPSAA